MYISKLTISNYRTFREFSIDLKPLTLIIGENNIGKSNLLDCIGLIFSQEVSYYKRRMLELADFNYDTIVALKKKILDDSIQPELIEYPKIVIQATVKDWNPDQGAVVADWYSNETFTEATLTYVFAPVNQFDKNQHIIEQRNFISNYRKNYGHDEFKKISEENVLGLIDFPIGKYAYRIYGGNAVEATVNPYFLNQLKFELLDALRDAGTELVASHQNKLLFRILNAKEDNAYQDLKGQLIYLQEAIKNNSTLTEIKNGISDQLDKISLATDQTTNIVDLLFSTPEVSDLLKKISLIYGTNPIKIERNGTGRNNLLFISLILSYIEDINHSNAVYFRVVGLEEPESHLHPNLQDHLAHNIELLIKTQDPIDPKKKVNRKDIQLLITSHSTHITTKVDFENTVVLYEDDDKKLVAHYVLSGFDDKAKSRKQVRYLNKYLDATNTNIFYSRKTILVEGISEKLLMPIFFKKITGLTTEKASCCIVNVNGLAFANFLEIMKNGFFQRCLVLTDSDSKTQTLQRPLDLKTRYESKLIQVQISSETTFEKDLIESNKSGEGRQILLDALVSIRPTVGKTYRDKLGAGNIEVEAFFGLIEAYKSEFAYALMLGLEENDHGFTVPEYINKGILFLIDDKKN
ncbi:AAA family ATPase [Sphingobacterium phlebotomi]|uniref:AAA family ATPase n=1 Tax=Sphingobacterium phlebotomi TaxID=2605433 RepID=A0A5D4H7P4_9SPHI|nr:AAA family ATPase [Sphingobacterium phlebotomi]TYR36708.1 AAA family ATPase [Sphingobacterium phlebotomi]